jgi:hypothetical protein
MVSCDGCGRRLSTPNWGAIPLFTQGDWGEPWKAQPRLSVTRPRFEPSMREYKPETLLLERSNLLEEFVELYFHFPIRLGAWCTSTVLCLSHLVVHFEVKFKGCGYLFKNILSRNGIRHVYGLYFRFRFIEHRETANVIYSAGGQNRHVRMWRQIKFWNTVVCAESPSRTSFHCQANCFKCWSIRRQSINEKRTESVELTGRKCKMYAVALACLCQHFLSNFSTYTFMFGGLCFRFRPR